MYRITQYTSSRLPNLSSHRRVTIARRGHFSRHSARLYTEPAPNSTLPENEVLDRVMGVIKTLKTVDGSIEVKPTSHFVSDLGMDSLETVELLMAMEDEFNITIPEMDMGSLLSVSSVTKYFATHPNAK